MLLTFMYHRVSSDPKAFARHLEYLVNNYPIVLPGDNIKNEKSAVCLTFDDAYFDFYHYIFPLLKQFNTKALLAVAPKYILDTTNIDANTRLNVPYLETMQGDIYKTHAPFCTWEELIEMANSKHVSIASHSYSHADLSDINADFNQEIINSKAILEKKLKHPITSFVYPYGNTSKEAQKIVCANYQYSLRIGSALNRSWHNSVNYIYRIDAEYFWPQNKKWTKQDYRKYLVKYFINILRRK